MSEYNSDDGGRTALLQALRPFVKERRYAKLDRAIQIAKLSRLIRVALEVRAGGWTGPCITAIWTRCPHTRHPLSSGQRAGAAPLFRPRVPAIPKAQIPDAAPQQRP